MSVNPGSSCSVLGLSGKKNRSVGNINNILDVEARVRHASQHRCTSLSFPGKAIIPAGTELWSSSAENTASS